MDCEQRGGERLLRIRTWSGDESRKVPDLGGSEIVYHCVGFRNWKSYPDCVTINGKVERKSRASAKFVRHPNSHIDRDRRAIVLKQEAHEWTYENFLVPKRKKGWRPWPREERNEFVVLDATDCRGPQNISTKIMKYVSPLRMNTDPATFNLDITVDT